MAGQERVVLMFFEARQQGLQACVDITDHSDCHGVTSAYMGRIGIDLDNLCFVWIELGPGEIRSE